ncbi:hypothetical protein B296_00039370 [Ensete ventricosum]|uniref:Uncharacterized protein n=1 Tax=Ensete ventricosum TaxID=4639 RepID=A0A426YLH4_ENSVE|nr:hypothetical protein B296_00039370 [Ensete ventricosum]
MIRFDRVVHKMDGGDQVGPRRDRVWAFGPYEPRRFEIARRGRTSFHLSWIGVRSTDRVVDSPEAEALEISKAMAGKEVREYTNLSDPKGIAAGELLDTFSLQLLLPVFVIVRRDDCSPSNDSQIGNGGKAKTRSTTRTSPSSGWWLRLADRPFYGSLLL